MSNKLTRLKLDHSNYARLSFLGQLVRKGDEAGSHCSCSHLDCYAHSAAVGNHASWFASIVLDGVMFWTALCTKHYQEWQQEHQQ